MDPVPRLTRSTWIRADSWIRLHSYMISSARFSADASSGYASILEYLIGAFNGRTR